MKTNKLTGHTPGPWIVIVDKLSDCDRYFVGVRQPASGTIKENHDICQVFAIGDDGRDGGPTEANARLIAAAPDLLAAARRILSFGVCRCKPETQPDYQCPVCELRAAIEKAEVQS